MADRRTTISASVVREEGARRQRRRARGNGSPAKGVFRLPAVPNRLPNFEPGDLPELNVICDYVREVYWLRSAVIDEG